MLIELWERLHGYDKWVEATAKVESSQEVKATYQDRYGRAYDTWSSGDVIVWMDAHGEKQYASFTVDEGSRLFQLIDGDSVTIRYNPSKPDEFFYPDLFRFQIRRFMQTILFALFIAALLAFAVWLRLSGRSGH